MMTLKRIVAGRMKKRVLVAEGEPLVRYGLSQLINHQPDLEVCGERENDNQIVENIVITQPDLLIIDLFLISISSYQLLETITVQSPRLGILVLSRHDEFLYAPRVLKLGAKGYLRKEASTDQILVAMRHVLRGEIFVSDRLREVRLNAMLGISTNDPSSALVSLSDRELEVFHLLGQGYATAKIASALHRSVKTIDSHRQHIKQKLKLQTTAELMRLAIQWHTKGPPLY